MAFLLATLEGNREDFFPFLDKSQNTRSLRHQKPELEGVGNINRPSTDKTQLATAAACFKFIHLRLELVLEMIDF